MRSAGAIASEGLLERSGRGHPAVPQFHTENSRWQATYDAALKVLAGNVQTMPRVNLPVLIEGSVYQGIWMECGPHESLVYRRWRPDVARNSHTTFFALQRLDGQFPANNKVAGMGFGQIQMVVPLASTAWELARATGDEELLRTAYDACARWDAWLVKYRDTRKTGLVEGFCTYDTGNDNSPRWQGMPDSCPGGEARNLPPVSSLPRLCPDLSATVYGARVALAQMAQALGRSGEAAAWQQQAASLRARILDKLYVAADASFYDLDAEDHFIRIRSEVLTRVVAEHVVDQSLFDHLWDKQLGNTAAFWPAYPLPSVALNDPAFVRPIPRNSWGGASQALTALRATRWFDHYKRSAELGTLLDRWCVAIQRDGTFRTQVDPLTGDFTQADAPGYSPTALVFVDSTWRLAGLVETTEALHWNVRPGHPAAHASRFELFTDTRHRALLRYLPARTLLQYDGHTIAEVTAGIVRVVTSPAGRPLGVLGIADTKQQVTIKLHGRAPRTLFLKPNEYLPL